MKKILSFVLCVVLFFCVTSTVTAKPIYKITNLRVATRRQVTQLEILTQGRVGTDSRKSRGIFSGHAMAAWMAKRVPIEWATITTFS